MFFPELDTAPDCARLALKLRNKAVAPLRNGDFRVYEDSIAHISKEGKAGDCAVLFDLKQKFAGAGLYDPFSPVRVKVLTNSAALPKIGPELISYLAAEAVRFREGKIPPQTDAYRLANGESDGFPGLAADRYGDSLALKLYSAAWIPWVFCAVKSFFDCVPELKRFVIRLSREVAKLPENVLNGLTDGKLFSPAEDGAWNGCVLFRENGLTFEADLVRGQKTGFFLDQRDNRDLVGHLAENADVLNVFSYSGGFSLYAARGGAKSVCDVDFSKYAISESERNFERNRKFSGVAACRHTGIVGDAFEVMENLVARHKCFDLVIVDPPSFAKAGSEVEPALKSYARLARLGALLVRQGGILVFASCSSRVHGTELFPVVNAAISEAGRRAEVFRITEHGPDHPAKFPESRYLKCQYAKIFR